LLGNAALAAQDTAGALGHARAALAADPENSEARELAGDAHAARGEFTAALAEYEALFASGRDVQAALALLSQRGATAALLERDRPMALRRYLRARELGLSDEELGFGATVLAEEAHRRVGEGLAAREAGDPERAGEAFARALELDPHSLETESLLALVLFERGEFDGAAQHWRSVLDAARERALELEEPVHLHLARALHRLGRDGEVRAVLEDYLAREPEGEWAGATREMLGKL